ncbi:MAG: integrase core domain-containing protein [Micropepsaceae bacterium]
MTAGHFILRCAAVPSMLLLLANVFLTIGDLFTVPTINYRELYAFVVVELNRRHLAFVTATSHPTATWLAQQINEAFPWDSAPRFLIRNNDAKFGHAFKRRVEACGIRDRPIAPQSPWQNGYAERVIGSIRRECLDHVVVWNDAHLRALLSDYADYYNASRTHLALEKDIPDTRPVFRVGKIVPLPILGGLHHLYERCPAA